MNGIVETFFGEYLDLDKVVSVSKARFNNGMGSLGYLVGFEIRCQLMKDPIIYERRFEYDELTRGRQGLEPILDENGVPLAVVRLQKQVDDFVQQWKDYKDSKQT